jgi:hypothetical protein
MLAAALIAFGAIMAISGNVVVRYALLPTWVLLGIGYSGVMTPAGRLLRRSAGAADRPAVFAAQFALSHLCWLLTYPLAGWLGSSAGIAPTAWVLAILTLSGVALAFYFWPAVEADLVPHQHPELPPDHPHLREQSPDHTHAYVLDDLASSVALGHAPLPPNLRSQPGCMDYAERMRSRYFPALFAVPASTLSA